MKWLRLNLLIFINNIFGSNSLSWFWVVLANNLENPECQLETNQPFNLNGLNQNFDKIENKAPVIKW